MRILLPMLDVQLRLNSLSVVRCPIRHIRVFLFFFFLFMRSIAQRSHMSSPRYTQTHTHSHIRNIHITHTRSRFLHSNRCLPERAKLVSFNSNLLAIVLIAVISNGNYWIFVSFLIVEFHLEIISVAAHATNAINLNSQRFGLLLELLRTITAHIQTHTRNKCGNVANFRPHRTVKHTHTHTRTRIQFSFHNSPSVHTHIIHSVLSAIDEKRLKV